MDPSVLLVVMVGLGTSWAVQMILAERQARAFRARVRAMGDKGTTAVGRSQKGHRGVAYCALATDDRGRVVDAAILKGLTVFARPRPFPEAVGRQVEDLTEPTSKNKLHLAAAEAARTLITEGSEGLDADSVGPTGGDL